jgi:hypothetical protein
MPPYDHMMFEVFKAEQAAAVLDEAEKVLRADGRDEPHVAASTDGQGQVMVELGSDNADLLETAAAQVREALGASTGAHRVTGDGIVKLTQQP